MYELLAGREVKIGKNIIKLPLQQPGYRRDKALRCSYLKINIAQNYFKLFTNTGYTTILISKYEKYRINLRGNEISI